MRDVTADVTRRDAMAKAAAPYRHPQLSSIKHGGDEKLDHAIRIIWPGMPPIGNEGSDSQISAEGSIPALPPPDAEMGDHGSAPPGGEDGGDHLISRPLRDNKADYLSYLSYLSSRRRPSLRKLRTHALAVLSRWTTCSASCGT
jgi:hypothetical protein